MWATSLPDMAQLQYRYQVPIDDSSNKERLSASFSEARYQERSFPRILTATATSHRFWEIDSFILQPVSTVSKRGTCGYVPVPYSRFSFARLWSDASTETPLFACFWFLLLVLSFSNSSTGSDLTRVCARTLIGRKVCLFRWESVIQCEDAHNTRTLIGGEICYVVFKTAMDSSLSLP
jgi:hypothetical protein